MVKAHGTSLIKFVMLGVTIVTAVQSVLPTFAYGEPHRQPNAVFDAMPLPTAIQFPVVFKTAIDSSKARPGDQVKAYLKEDLEIDQRLVAPEGSVVIGHIDTVHQSRRLAKSAIMKEDRFRKNGSVRIIFDEIVTPMEEHIRITGIVSKQSAVFEEGRHPREVVVGNKGEFKKAEEVLTTDEKTISNVFNYGVNYGLTPLGTVASFGALPVIMGVIGAIDPSMVTQRVVLSSEKHPRIFGFTYGAIGGLPGAPALQAFMLKGSEINIKAGDELLIQAHSPYDETARSLGVSSQILTPGFKQTAGPLVEPAHVYSGSNKVLTPEFIENPYGSARATSAQSRRKKPPEPTRDDPFTFWN
jgi:hypothetical protein